MAKKQILFVVTYLDTGGTNRSLECLLSNIDTQKYDVDVFAMVPYGAFADRFLRCNVLGKNVLLYYLTQRLNVQKGLNYLCSAIVKALAKVPRLKVKDRIYRNAARNLSRRKNYDAVVAYSEGAPTLFVSMMDTQNKIAWIHCDYQSYFDLNDHSDETGIYSKFESIVCVSQYTSKSFSKIYPSLGSRVCVINNLLDVESIKNKSAEPIDEASDKSVHTIVSIGRLDPVKQLSIIPSVALKIKERGLRFRWYIIGPKGGNLQEYERLEHAIESMSLADEVIYIGEKANPYNYIAHADVLVCPSKSEACPYVINESKIIGTPVICTNFGSSSEFVENGASGLICAINDLPNTLYEFLTNREIRCRIKSNLSSFNYDNNALLSEVYKLLDK